MRHHGALPTFIPSTFCIVALATFLLLATSVASAQVATNWPQAPVPSITGFSPVYGGSTYYFHINGQNYGTVNAGKTWTLTNPDTQTLRMEVRPGDFWPYAGYDSSGCSNGGQCANRNEVSPVQEDGGDRLDVNYGTKVNMSYELMVEPGAANTASFLNFHQVHVVPNIQPYAVLYIGLVWGEDRMMISGYNQTNTWNTATLYQDPNPIQHGHWYSMNIQMNVVNDSTGYLFVWRDGVQIVNYHGPLGFGPGYNYYSKFGIYRGAKQNSGADTPETYAVKYRNYMITQGSLPAPIFGTIPPPPSPPANSIFSSAASQFQSKPNGALQSDGTWGILGNAAVSTPVSFPASGTYTFHADAYGSYAGGGWPIMQLQIDGQSVGEVNVSSSTLQSYTLSAFVSAGTHTVGIAFTNDYYGGTSKTDRNLYVNSLSIAPSTVFSGAVSQFQSKPNGALQSDGTWGILGNAAVSTPVSFPASGPYTFHVDAYGSYAGGGWPIMQLQIDGQSVGEVNVSSSTLQSYTLSAFVSAGTHTVGIAFTNDYYGGTSETDRNLYVNSLSIAPSTVFSGAVSQFQSKPNGALQSDGTWGILGNAAVSTPVSFPASGTYTFHVDAYGSYAGGGWPTMQLQIDGTSVGQVTVSSATLGNYTFNAPVTAGTHTVGIAFTNDYYDPTTGADRNLYVKDLTITAAPVDTIAPSIPDPSDPNGPGNQAGGCSTSDSSSAGLVFGLALIGRRRRRW